MWLLLEYKAFQEALKMNILYYIIIENNSIH